MDGSFKVVLLVLFAPLFDWGLHVQFQNMWGATTGGESTPYKMPGLARALLAGLAIALGAVCLLVDHPSLRIVGLAIAVCVGYVARAAYDAKRAMSGKP
jgi:hypothetical protein